MKKWRVVLTSFLVCAAFLLGYTQVNADSPDCNNFEAIQSVILSEATHQPFAAQLEVARVVVTKGACFRDSHFYTGYGVAERILSERPHDCIANTHCRAYFLLDTIDPRLRELPALAAHVALTESPRVPRYHFDRWDSNAYWWNSPSACPAGWFIVGELKVC